MLIRRFLIAEGNPTILVWDYLPWEKQSIVKKFLPDLADQVGFVSQTANGAVKLEMMGNELCINATLALAANYKKSGQLSTSVVNETVKYVNRNGLTSLALNLPYKIIDNTILFKGIGYTITNKSLNPEIVLPALASRFNLPAFGLVTYQNKSGDPVVFVKETQSIVNETSCGSGSIAFSLLNKVSKIIQPSGNVIKVQKSSSGLIITAKVTEIKLE